MQIPAIIVCGFLGAGKTTLLRRLLADPKGLRYGVLLNDFGALDIDGAMLAEAGADRVVLDNGCICCAVPDELTAGLERLLEDAPDRIVIETSGISRPLPVAEALAAEPFRDRVRLDGIYCLIDSAGFDTLDFADTELAIDQAVGADLVLLNKADLAGPTRVAAVENTLRGAMPRVRLLATEGAALPRELLFAGSEAAPHDHHHHHHHDDEWDVWSWQSEATLDAARLRRALKALPAGVLRAKGIAPVQDEVLTFQTVGKRVDIAPLQGPARPASAVAIGRRGAFDGAALTELFNACAK